VAETKCCKYTGGCVVWEGKHSISVIFVFIIPHTKYISNTFYYMLLYGEFMFISTFDINSCSVVLDITEAGTPQIRKLFCELAMASDHSLCETQLSWIVIFDASARCSWMPYICQNNLLARPQCMQLDLEAISASNTFISTYDALYSLWCRFARQMGTGTLILTLPHRLQLVATLNTARRGHQCPDRP
jgi:hypothetical protein